MKADMEQHAGLAAFALLIELVRRLKGTAVDWSVVDGAFMSAVLTLNDKDHVQAAGLLEAFRQELGGPDAKPLRT